MHNWFAAHTLSSSLLLLGVSRRPHLFMSEGLIASAWLKRFAIHHIAFGSPPRIRYGCVHIKRRIYLHIHETKSCCSFVYVDCWRRHQFLNTTKRRFMYNDSCNSSSSSLNDQATLLLWIYTVFSSSVGTIFCGNCVWFPNPLEEANKKNAAYKSKY